MTKTQNHKPAQALALKAMLISVILCGRTGKQFYPQSDESQPKRFILLNSENR